MATYEIRVFGDPVLKTKAAEVTDVDAKLVTLADQMLELMYTAPGLGLAAPQIGVQKQLFVYDTGDGPHTLVNPTIRESSGEWVYDEGCLSIPGLYVEIARPKEVLLHGWDLDGNEVTLEADELTGPALPARARPPQRRAHVRAHDRRPAQGSAEGVASAPDRAT